MFLNNFDKRDENAGVNVKLREVYLEEHLPHYVWQDKGIIYNDLKVKLADYINRKNHNKMLLILGQPGIGKSTLITWIVSNFVNNIDDILVYRFTSDLKKINWRNINNNLDICNMIFNELGLQYNLKSRGNYTYVSRC